MKLVLEKAVRMAGAKITCGAVICMICERKLIISLERSRKGGIGCRLKCRIIRQREWPRCYDARKRLCRQSELSRKPDCFTMHMEAENVRSGDTFTRASVSKPYDGLSFNIYPTASSYSRQEWF